MTHLPNGASIAPPISLETARFLDALFGDQAGWLCLGVIDGHPLIEDMRSEWYDWPRQRPLILRRFAEHVAHGRDIYVRQVLFAKRSATEAHVLPSAWIWRDDVKDIRTASTGGGRVPVHHAGRLLCSLHGGTSTKPLEQRTEDR